MERWKYKELVVEDEFVLLALALGHASSVIDGIVQVEMSILGMMQSSRFYSAGKKQFDEDGE